MKHSSAISSVRDQDTFSYTNTILNPFQPSPQPTETASKKSGRKGADVLSSSSPKPRTTIVSQLLAGRAPFPEACSSLFPAQTKGYRRQKGQEHTSIKARTQRSAEVPHMSSAHNMIYPATSSPTLTIRYKDNESRGLGASSFEAMPSTIVNRAASDAALTDLKPQRKALLEGELIAFDKLAATSKKHPYFKGYPTPLQVIPDSNTQHRLL